MRLTVLFALALALAIPATADTRAADSRADVTALIRAGDAAGAFGATDADDPVVQRGAFWAFSTAHPDAGRVSAALLAAHPGDARAMVARGWHLYSLGWALRGTAPLRSVYPEALERMDALHAEARALAEAAVAADPALLPASDLLILISRTTGGTEVIAQEFERIMTLAPNRQSLILAVGGMVPVWGGPPGWGEEACRDWADRIADTPGYSVDLCLVDIVFNAPYSWQDQQAATSRLDDFDSPLLDAARRARVLSGRMPTEATIAALEAMQAQDMLDIETARMLDSLRGDAGPDGVGPATLGVLETEIPRLRAEADFDPANVQAVSAYIAALILEGAATGAPIPERELDTRYAQLFALAPYDGETWMRFSFLLSQNIDYQTVALDRIDRIRSYIVNGVHYTNHAAASLAWLDTFNRLTWDALDRRNVDAVDRTGTTAFPKEAFDASVICPTIRAIRVLQAICAIRPGSEGCPGADDPTSPWPALFARAEAREACAAERSADPQTLAYAAEPVDLPDGN